MTARTNKMLPHVEATERPSILQRVVRFFRPPPDSIREWCEDCEKEGKKIPATEMICGHSLCAQCAKPAVEAW